MPTTSPAAFAALPSLERLASVKSRTGLSRSEIYRRIAEGDFPAPVKLGKRASAWIVSEISEWIAERIAARRFANSPAAAGMRRTGDSA